MTRLIGSSTPWKVTGDGLGSEARAGERSVSVGDWRRYMRPVVEMDPEAYEAELLDMGADPEDAAAARRDLEGRAR